MAFANIEKRFAAPVTCGATLKTFAGIEKRGAAAVTLEGAAPLNIESGTTAVLQKQIGLRRCKTNHFRHGHWRIAESTAAETETNYLSAAGLDRSIQYYSNPGFRPLFFYSSLEVGILP